HLEKKLQTQEPQIVDETWASWCAFCGFQGRPRVNKELFLSVMPPNREFRFRGRKGLRILYQNVEAHAARVTESHKGRQQIYEFASREGDPVPVALWLNGEMFSRHGEALFLHFGGGRHELLRGLKKVKPGIHGNAFAVDGRGSLTWLHPSE